VSPESIPSLRRLLWAPELELLLACLRYGLGEGARPDPRLKVIR
jgi:hypothetical protein